jgi:heme exporter protein D
MYWNSFAEFLAMGKHGVYVWGSFIVMALAMIAEPLIVIKGQKGLIARLRRQFRAEKAEQRAAQAHHFPKGKQ